MLKGAPSTAGCWLAAVLSAPCFPYPTDDFFLKQRRLPWLLAQILLSSGPFNDLKPPVIALFPFKSGFLFFFWCSLVLLSSLSSEKVHLFFMMISGSPVKHGKKKFLLKNPNWLEPEHAHFLFSLGNVFFSIVQMKSRVFHCTKCTLPSS